MQGCDGAHSRVREATGAEPRGAKPGDASGVVDRQGVTDIPDIRHKSPIQSEHEGTLVEAIHGARDRCAAIVINPGAFTHYAWAIHDALAAFPGPVVEVHLSNPQRREAWRHTSVVAPVATATVAGLGGTGYVLAIEAVADLLGRP